MTATVTPVAVSVAAPVPAPRPATPLVAVPHNTPAVGTPPPPVPPLPPPAAIRPAAGAARPRFRHWALVVSFLLLVAIPFVTVAGYLWTRAADQYVSTLAFSIRKTEQKGGGLDILSGLAAFTGSSGGGASDNDILSEYFVSPDLVTRLSQRLDLPARFSAAWPRDFWYAYDPEGTIEDLVRYWKRQVTVLNDDKSGIITVHVAAFTPQDAQQIADAIYAEGTRFINQLSDIAREDATRFARGELDKAEARVREVRQQFTDFRTRTQIVDPSAEFAGAMGIVGTLEGQLAEAMVAQDLLLESNTRDNDPRLEQARRRIAAIEGRIAQERSKFSADSAGPGGESYAKLVAEYERLTSDRQFAETAYTAARANLDLALADAERQTRYLAAHVAPQEAQRSERPNRWLTLVFFGVFSLMIWAIGVLIYYSVRDRG